MSMLLNGTNYKKVVMIEFMSMVRRQRKNHGGKGYLNSFSLNLGL